MCCLQVLLCLLPIGADDGAVRIVPRIDAVDRVQPMATLDLRGLSPAQAEAMGAELSVRLRWPESRLTLRTALARPGYLCLEIRAADRSGARLLVSAGGSTYTAAWPKREAAGVDVTHAIPVPAGEQRVLVSAIGGTVVVASYTLVPADAPPEGTEPLPANPAFAQRALDGYRGIWYYNEATHDEYVWKYSGGLGTYCANHICLAEYAPAVDKTFFVYGGTADDANRLVMMAGCYDHATGLVSRPTQIADRQTDDAHENPVLSIDADGFLWVFAANHGSRRPSFLYRSLAPYSIDAFELIAVTNASYPQPHYVPGKGFFFLHTIYGGGRRLYWMTSEDGLEWSAPQELAGIENGHYQVSWNHGETVGSAFNYHPAEGGLNFRTNLYYAETRDWGRSWTAADGTPLELPLRAIDNPALVRDYAAEGLKVYTVELNYDAEGRPVITYVLTRGWRPGPENGPRTWAVAHWTGRAWAFHDITTSDSNYDDGCLHIEADGTWRLIAPTEPGPQPGNPGGEIYLWLSHDEGASWERVRQMTHDSPLNHTYVRRPRRAHPGFYGFWADGHGREPSESRLYFCNRAGDAFRLPTRMEGEWARPEPVE